MVRIKEPSQHLQRLLDIMSVLPNLREHYVQEHYVRIILSKNIMSGNKEKVIGL